MLLSYNNGITGVILRVKLLDSSVTTGAGLEGLTFNSAGLIISTIADNEAAAVAYTQAAGNIEDITTLGTYAAPTASKCRFKQVDATNHKGVYEIQLDNSRYAVSSARSLLISILGATNLAQADAVVQLTAVTPEALVDSIWDEVIEGAVTARQSMRLANAANAGKTNSFVPGGTGTGNVRDLGDTLNRIQATYDANGNRTAVTRDLS